MNDSIKIRNAERHELAAVLSMVGLIVDETYGHLFSEDTPVPIDAEQWNQCLVSTIGNRMVGVVLTEENRVEDLWLLKQYRGRRVGSQLLTRAESQILNAGFTVGRLRVVAENEPAIDFYKARGWTTIRYYQHEQFDFKMVDMEKYLSI